MTGANCPTGKAKYSAVEASRRAQNASRRTDERIAAYRCQQCSCWHIGHTKPRVSRPIPFLYTNHQLSLT